MNLRILFVKTEKLSDFLGRGSKLFHSNMVDGKKELLKKLCFVFRREMLCIFRVEFNEHLARGIKLKRYLFFHFPRPYKRGKVFYTSVNLEGIPVPILDIFFLLAYPVLHLSRLGMRYI